MTAKRKDRVPKTKKQKPLSTFVRTFREHLETLRVFLKELNGGGKNDALPANKDLGKIGFVLSGGFFQGAFQIGALKYVAEQGHIAPHYVVGSSIGAVNGAAVVMNKVGQAQESWSNLKKDEVYSFSLRKLIGKGVIGSDSLFDHRPLLDLIRRHGSGEDLLSSPIQFDVIVTDFEKMDGTVFSNRIEKDPEAMELAILASAAIPVVFPPVYISGRQYVDGGVIESTPLSYAIDAGCDTIFIFDVSKSAAVGSGAAAHGLFTIGLRTFEIITRRQVGYDVHHASEVNNDITVLEDIRRFLSDKKVDDGMMMDIETRLQRLSFAKKHRVRLVVIQPDISLPFMSPSIRKELDIPMLRLMIDHGALVAEKVLKEEKII